MSLQKILDRVSNLKEKLRDGHKNKDVIDWELIDIEQMIASEMNRINKSESISGVSERFSIGQMIAANGYEFKVVEDTGDNNVLISSNRSIKDEDYNDWWIPREMLNAL